MIHFLHPIYKRARPFSFLLVIHTNKARLDWVEFGMANHESDRLERQSRSILVGYASE